MNERTYICTRSRLARQLIEADQQYKPIVNPWDPTREAWLFTMTEQLVSIVAKFYHSIGKPVPAYITQAAEELNVDVEGLANE